MEYLRDELRDYRAEYGLSERIKCTKEESNDFIKLLKLKKPLPDGIYYHRGDGTLSDPYYFYREDKSEISRQEVEELIKYRQTEYLKSINYKTASINKGVRFFVTISVIGLIICAIWLLLNIFWF